MSHTTAIAIAGLLLLPGPLAGQAMYPRDIPTAPAAPTWLRERAKLPPYDPPRMADGHPDLRGVWEDTVSQDDIEDHPWIDDTTPPQESLIADPPDGKIPYQPWALAQRNAFKAGLGRGWPGESKERLHVDNATFCMVGVPRTVLRSAFEVMQTPGYVTMVLNWGHYYRVIPTDGRPRLGSQVKLAMGNARGRWEGDTLVVETTNLNAKVWFDSVGNFYSDAARVVERFKLANANTIDYEATIDDPAVYTRPWTIAIPLRRVRPRAPAAGAAPDPHANEMWEHACHEGNRDAQDLRELGFRFFSGVVPPR